MTTSASSGKTVLGLVLAGGRGSRFSPDGSRNKLLAQIDGKPVCVNAALALKNAQIRVLAATSPRTPEVAKTLAQAGCEILVCDKAAQGMGATLAQAVAQASAIEQAAGNEPPSWCVMPADMPRVATATVVRLLEVWRKLPEATRKKCVLAPAYRGERGHPVLFGSDWSPALARLTGDEGARAIIKGHLTLIEVDDPGCLFDVDTPEALATANVGRMV
jgi:molybdenum cofactor cytidylyltransferase